jgi:segregation and condensation protein A
MTDRLDPPAAADPVPSDPVPTDWGDPPRMPRGDLAPVLAVDGFAGPLDWLLEMVRASKIDLARLSIAALIEAFATAMDTALAQRTGVDIARWAAWTVMAATLTEIWSRLLLPADALAAREAGAEAEALRRQLLDRAHLRAAADWLERQPLLGREVFPRGAPEIAVGGRGADITALLRACLVALKVPEAQAAALRPRPIPLWGVSDAIGRVQELLPVLPDGSPLRDFLPRIGLEAPRRETRCRAALASTLIAGLELARTGELALDQGDDWAPVRLLRGEARRVDGSDRAERAA